jgi:predicted phosphodiesterase
MKIHILSDLHLEFGPFTPPDTDADLVILAGDIHRGKRGLEWATTVFANKPVIYILGNHEYYGKALPKWYHALVQMAASTNVEILERTSVCFGGVRFLGCSLWTDLRLQGDPWVASYAVEQAMNDYRKIRVNPRYRKLRAADTVAIHHQAKGWLESELAENHDGPTVIVTHHAPSRASVPAEWQEDITASAYASVLDDLVTASRAELWVHGHIHAAKDYVMGETRVLCNPRGYTDEPVAGFRPGLVVEIERGIP